MTSGHPGTDDIARRRIQADQYVVAARARDRAADLARAWPEVLGLVPDAGPVAATRDVRETTGAELSPFGQEIAHHLM